MQNRYVQARFLARVIPWLVAPVLSAERPADDYASAIKPLLAEFCFSCHGEEKHKADLNLVSLGKDGVRLEDRAVWMKVREMVASREMPPENKPQPSDAQRLALTRFLETRVAQVDCDGQIQPGRVTVRRLNRAEYNNTLRDLLGVDFKPSADFPLDEVGYGFDNIGDVLSLPPILMEKYLAAAEQVVTQTLARALPSPILKHIEAETLPSTANGGFFEDRALSLDTEGEAHLTHSFAETGEYTLRARAFGQQAGPDPTRLAFRIDGHELARVDVSADETKPGVYEVRARIEAGEHRVGWAYVNNYNMPNHPDPKLRGDRNLVVDWVEIEGPAPSGPADLPPALSRIFCCAPQSGQERDCAGRVLREYAGRAYRRELADADIDRLLVLFDAAKADGASYREALALPMQAVLVSPHFLFRWELNSTADGPGKIQPLDRFEFASRLSYFLWSSLPDDELLALARNGRLEDPDIVTAHTRRMLQSPKSRALVENFASQWLQTRNLDSANPDPEIFPEFDEPLRHAMRQEADLFFEAMMREDRSIREFLDADFTFLNERLARHYGIPGIQGETFQRVALSPAAHRGGILSQASFLTITSNPNRTSAVARGKWILEQILGSPPPPPPPDVPELNAEPGTQTTASLREKLEIHRAKPECATCHNKMDPLGFAFENYNAIGAWRETDGKFPIDPAGVLPDGRAFQGPTELKAMLKENEIFIKTLVEKMLTYALGRGLEYYDFCTVDKICKCLAEHDYRFSELVLGIVESPAFRYRLEKE